MASGKAIVKQIISGDTVLLVGNAKNGPPPELMLTLSMIQAPKFTRNPEQSQLFAYESREFLRQLLIGKSVTFKVEYKISTINREFGSVYLNNENVMKIILREGWAKLKPIKEGTGESMGTAGTGAGATGITTDSEELLQLAEEAMTLKKGIYSEIQPIESIKYSGFDMQAIYEQNKGTQLRGIVEMIRDGSSMRILLVKNMCVMNILLTGVQCPRLNFTTTSTNKEEDSGQNQPQPYAKEAKYFTETHLLQREVNLTMEGTDKYGNIYASVLHHPSGNDISVELIKNGLAKTNDWSINYTSVARRALLRNAEKFAKQNKLRIWKNYVAPKIEGEKSFQGKILEVVSGDCVIVLSTDSHTEHRVYLSSIRAPRVRKDDSDPYGFESKEFLRRKAVGKQVTVTIDYEKDPPPGTVGPAAQKRSYGTVVVTEKANKTTDLGLAIIKEGLAEVIHHRQDEERASNYGEYTDAQEVALKSKKGLHSGKAAPIRRYNDVSSDSTKAKQFLPFLKRENNLKAVVEQVFSGSKLKVYIPKENCMLTYIIAGIKCPALARPGVPNSISEPFAEEAKAFTRETLMQRDITIAVEDMDRGGSAFGPVILANGKNFACILLEEGLATVDSYSIERTRHATELQNAEGLGRQNKRGIWLSAATTPKSKSSGNEQTVQISDNVERVRLSEIINVNNFFIHKLSSKDLPIIESKLMEFTKEHGQRGTPVDIRKGINCFALFDDEHGPVWNRAKIEAIASNGDVRVRFVDYGNVATLPINKISGVDPALNNYPPQAHECTLAFIKTQSLDEEFGTDAALLLREVAWGRNLLARIHGKDEQNRLIVSLYENEKNLIEKLLEKGLVRVDRRSIKTCATYQKDIGKRYIEIQEKAKRDRLHIWRYGDIESDDEDTASKPWGKRQ